MVLDPTPLSMFTGPRGSGRPNIRLTPVLGMPTPGLSMAGRLAADLRAAFPEMKGFSSSNLKYMRFFAQDVSHWLDWSAAC